MAVFTKKRVRQFGQLIIIYAGVQIAYYSIAQDEINWMSIIISSLFYGIIMTALFARAYSNTKNS
ncbi:hypothetical protein EAX61_11680 [Dokdonia sinensis]|uniref:Uncharacterized protein n=1 Tax=Dokdonia sinensis TaxID=2479847 RepID=A0A3M0G8M1_9FLAO|nr:hypothetical protein [Dokdonia sinensis]RMB57399.1 hypothetical protein EAX61_11680 [Dokdonia sinensis]